MQASIMVDFRNDAAFIRYIAAGSPWTSEILLCHLAKDADPQIRRRVAENPQLTQKIADILIEDENWEVRAAFSENMSAAEHYIERLICDPSPDVRYTLAENPATSIETLLRLAADENPYVAARAQRTYLQVNPAAIQELARLNTPLNALREATG